MTDPSIAENFDAVRARMDEAAKSAGRAMNDTSLVAISKKQPEPRIAAALEYGHRLFGENRVQEAQERWADRRADYPDLELRLVGPLQSNKTGDAVALFDVIETLDREKLAKTIVKEADKQGRMPRLYVQINTGEEDQKAGISPADADAFLETVRETHGLPVEGLMCIPPVGEAPAMHFALLAKIARRNGLDKLSMGMSGDYETAIRYGATSVRVGSALFGERP
ncbi:MAG: YggS family pyridoxal phosphate-dependent enzyme [Euryhalocaulis sp.]|uniref:YggS family pyridoxal phosphate-dependent enzyme n=1 Tax=Euryhalocaulis sp. TaxID=2744307 RepID=UPI0017C323F3|nr:YggS family pyridoxal phosphate-dependent enzyme [Euryhalocaulis sp.]MBA4801539.1 YggS family pyridoxal phosphate-dependent enzyme [Euryhalocaulis sp.]